MQKIEKIAVFQPLRCHIEQFDLSLTQLLLYLSSLFHILH